VNAALYDIARERVSRGIAALDAADPAWRGKVPATHIDMRRGRVSRDTGCGCVLAHWAGGYCTGTHNLGIRYDQTSMLVQRGFVVDLHVLKGADAEEQGDQALGEPGWRALDLAWCEALRGAR
jgi:hypothetical protein